MHASNQWAGYSREEDPARLRPQPVRVENGWYFTMLSHNETMIVEAFRLLSSMDQEIFLSILGSQDYASQCALAELMSSEGRCLMGALYQCLEQADVFNFVTGYLVAANYVN
jgi:hypothetical protein